MGSSLQYLLPLWSAIGVYTILGLIQWNGTFKLLSDVNKTELYPETDVHARSDFTGIEQLDSLLRTLNITFWPLLDGSSPAASLHAFQFAGAYGATSTLLFLESIRAGNRWKAVSFITITIIVAQLASYGATIPLYLALQLWTSPAVSGRQQDAILVHPWQAKLLPYSIILGYLVPVTILSFPSLFNISPEEKQSWIALWNIFPITVKVIHVVLTFLVGGFSRPQHTAYTKKNTRLAIQSVYAFAFGLATITHVASWTISLGSILFPALYSPPILAEIHPVKVFLPIFSYEATPWPLGIHRLLQWDNFIGSTAILGYAVVLWSNARRVSGAEFHLPRIFKAITLSVTSGFVGAATVFLWERDTQLLTEDTKEKKSQ